jgi:hypothetical protein
MWSRGLKGCDTAVTEIAAGKLICWAGMDFVLFIAGERESGRASKRAEAIFAVTMATTHSQPPTPAAGSSPAGLKGFSARYRGNPVAPQLRPSPPGCTSAQGTLNGLREWYPDGAACTLGGHPEQRVEHVCCSLQTRWQGRG